MADAIAIQLVQLGGMHDGEREHLQLRVGGQLVIWDDLSRKCKPDAPWDWPVIRVKRPAQDEIEITVHIDRNDGAHE